MDEDQISFRPDSLMVDDMEDYTHRIAEMNRLTNDSNFNEAGVSSILLHYNRVGLLACLSKYYETG